MFYKRILLINLLFIAATVDAQDMRDNFYAKVLTEELNRNIQKLHLPDLQKPFFISYKLRNSYSYTIRSERGEVTSTITTPTNNKIASVKLRVGDYHRNFDYMLPDGSFIGMPDENNADEYKRLLWLETDRAYKNTSQQYNATLASLKRVTVDEKELALDDLSKIKPVTYDYGAIKPITADRKKWETVLKELSKIFVKYPELTTSYCQVSFNNYEEYYVTSEGTLIRKPVEGVNFMAFAATTDEKGNNYNDRYSVYARTIADMPSTENIRGKIMNMVQNILRSKEAKKFEGSYLGPVLFTDDAASSLMQNMFGNGLNIKRKSVLGYDNGGSDYEDKLGQKLVSSDLTVTAYPKLKSFNGVQTTGSYDIDDEGVVPPDSLTLIQNGLLKSLMNGRTPTQKFSESQGFVKSFTGRVYNPGVLKITSSNTIAADSMKNKLIRLAKEEGLSAAYIVRDNNYTNADLYKVDLNTGEETLVTSCRITNFGIRSMRRFATASNRLKLQNTASQSIIAPESFIINEVEIEKENTTVKLKPIIVTNPLLDKKPVVAKTEKTIKKK